MAVLTVGVAYFLQNRLTAYFYDDYLANGRAMVERLAEESRLSLIQDAADNIQPKLDALSSDPRVIGAAVVTLDGRTVARQGRVFEFDPSGGPRADDPLLTDPSVRRDGRTVTLMAPVKATGREPFADTPYGDRPHGPRPPPPEPFRPLGYVALTLDLTALQSALARINHDIVMVMAAGAFSATVVLLWLLRHLTLPIKHLSWFMASPETLRDFRLAAVTGVREAQTIARAFNTLITQAARAHRELESSRSELVTRVENAVRDLRLQHAELEKAWRQAEEASRVKSAFIANMSHEMRTPMHGILGFLDVLGETPLDPTQRGHWRLLKHSLSNLLAVVNKTLDFSKLEAGKVHLMPRPFNLPDALAQTVELFKAHARAKRLTLQAALDPALPQWAFGDRQHLTHILSNLVDNALKFTRHGGVRVAARARPAPEGAAFELQVAVRDTGIGIPDGHRTTIFESFNQVDSSMTREQGGTGLGLAICQQLTHLMGGHLSVRSTEGVGSTFTVRLPLGLTDPPPPGERPSDRPADEGEADGDGVDPIAESIAPTNDVSLLAADDPLSARHFENSPGQGFARVLVVDDNLTNRVLVKTILQRLDAEVVMAETGQEALDLCRWGRFDLIVMDLMMPGMSGLDATRRIRRWTSNPNAGVPILGLTGTASEQRSDRWREAGMSDCFLKPLLPAQMRHIFQKWGISEC